MTIAFKSVQLDTNGPDHEGALAFEDDVLVAVFVKLSDLHGDLTGRWSMEACFFRSCARDTYDSLNAAGVGLAKLRLTLMN